MTTDADLVDRLDEVWGSISELGGELSEDEWKRATEVPGWSVQDNLTHISGMEASLLGRAPVEHEVAGDLPHVRNEIGVRNEVVVDSRRAMSGADALAEFREITRERVDVLRAYDEAAFSAESWTPVGPGTVRDLLPFRAFDSWVHEQDMRRAVDRPGDLDSAVAAAALERVVGSMPFVVGKKAAAPEGSTVVFDLDGPLARVVAIRVDGGRAKRLDETPDDPTVRISSDTETFARLGCGRVDAPAELGAGRVRIEGDDELGRRVVEQMNFLF
ncbi:MAG: maleylpyruvate isomerase family mycothiol-dependent enzyme [Acidimicrobiia bacterium]